MCLLSDKHRRGGVHVSTGRPQASLTMPPDPPSLPGGASSFPPVLGPGSASSSSSCSSGGSPLWSELISRSLLTSTPSCCPGPRLPPPPVSGAPAGSAVSPVGSRSSFLAASSVLQTEAVDRSVLRGGVGSEDQTCCDTSRVNKAKP